MSNPHNENELHNGEPALFPETIPPNHNPVIGMLPKDTLCNVRNCLYTLKSVSEVPEISGAEHTMKGFYVLMSCVADAVDFEIYSRK